MNLRTFARRCSAMACAIVFMPSLVMAQTSASLRTAGEFLNGDRGLSIEQLVAMALERSPDLLAARARLEAARGDRIQAGLRPNPRVATDLREQVGGPDRQSSIGIEWPLDLFRRSGRVATADRAVDQAGRDVAEAERRLAAAVRSKVISATAAIRVLELQERVAGTLEEFRDLAGARASSGAAPPLERDQADVEARRARADVFRRRAAVEAAIADLKAAVAIPQSEPLLLKHSLEQLLPLSQPFAPGTVERAVDVRADVLVAEAQVQTATAMVNQLRQEAKPELSLNASYMRMANGFPLTAFNQVGVLAPISAVVHNVAFGAMVTLPFRDKRQGDIAAANARVRAADRELEGRRLVAAAEIGAAGSRVERLDSALAVYAGGLRSLAAQNVEVVRQSHDLGRASLLDVLAETRRWLDTEMAYTELLSEALQARSDLSTAMGVIR